MKQTLLFLAVLFLAGNAFAQTAITSTSIGGSDQRKATPYTVATLPACNASTLGAQYDVTDGNKNTRTCRETTTGVYSWIDEGRIFDVKAFGAATGATAAVNVTAINAALTAINAAGRGVLDISDVSLNVNAAIPLVSNLVIRGNGTITQTANNTSLFTITAKSNITIEGLTFVGVGTDYVEAISDPAQAINAIGIVTGLTVENCRFSNFGNAAVKAKGSNIKLKHLTIVGVGSPTLTPVASGTSYGIVLEANTSDVTISDCTISETAQGIASGQQVSNVTISNSVIFNIRGQHGIYMGGGGLRNITISNVTVNNPALMGIKVQVDDAAGTDSDNVTITGCTVYGAATGIAATSGVANGTSKLRNVTIAGNSIRQNGSDDAMNIQDVIGGVVSGNMIEDVSRDGISCINCQHVVIGLNNIRNVGQNAIKLNVLSGGTSTGNSLVENKILNPATTNTANGEYGIHLRGSSHTHVKRNEVRDQNANMEWGIFVETGDQTTTVFEGNIIIGAAQQGIRYKAGESALINRDNYHPEGTLNLPQTNQRGNTGREFYSTAVPATGTWERGDVVWNYTPSANAAALWVCTVAGTPGTWVEVYSTNQATNTTASPSFNLVTTSSTAATTTIAASTNTAAEADIGTFTQQSASGFAAIRIDRPSTVRYALTKYSTAGTNDWMTGVAYGDGGGNSKYSIGTGISVNTDAKFRINGSTSTATGIELTSAAAGSGATLAAISSGTNEALNVNAKGTALVNIGSTGTATATAGAATLNTQSGIITSEALTTAAGGTYVLTITNSLITASSIVMASLQNGTNSISNVTIARTTPAAGSVTFVIYNNSGAALNGTLLISFYVVK